MKPGKPLERRTPLRATSGIKPKEPKPAKGPRKKKCKVCKSEFEPRTPLAVACGVACAIEHGKKVTAAQKAKAQRQERAQDKIKRHALKTIPELKAEAQKVFNEFVRLRDAGKPCICCGRTSDKTFLTGSNWDCGHYRSTGSADHLRYNEDNAHRQLVGCNRHGAGRAVDYRMGLIARIGLDRVEALESNNEVVKWTREMLEAIKARYAKKVRELKAFRKSI